LKIFFQSESDQILSTGEELQSAWDELKKKVADEFDKNDHAKDSVKFRLFYRMQYQGQLNDLEIEAPLERFNGVEDWDALVKTFEETYSRVYAKSALSPELGYSVTGAIVRGIVEVAKPKIPKEPLSGKTPPADAFLGKRKVYWTDGWIDANIYEMEKIEAGNVIGAFSILESTATTLVVPTGFEARLDENRIFHLKEL